MRATVAGMAASHKTIARMAASYILLTKTTPSLT